MHLSYRSCTSTSLKLLEDPWKVRVESPGRTEHCNPLIDALSDMDVVFALAYKEGVSPVEVSLRKDVPAAGTPEADEILSITDADGKRE